jgi:exodeoxyribonuclease III
MSSQKIRIVTWNCCKGDFTKKDAIFNDYNPGIAVIQEIKKPEKTDNHCIWIPNKLTKELGVCVISSKDLELQNCEGSSDLPEVFIPVKVSGKVTFNLLAVWTQKAGKYIESFDRILKEYNEFLHSAPSVIVGDFNSNPIWDKKHKFNHSMLNKKLEKEFDLVSAYHTHNKIHPGLETDNESTFFMYGHKDKPFHIDYCYVPKNWSIECAKIGSYDNWCNKEKINKERKSDHCPLIVDLLITDSDTKSEKNIIKPGKERFCADIVFIGNAPVPGSAKQLLKSVAEQNTSIRLK